MMPPLNGSTVQPGKRVVPYPDQSLKLGGGRWLEQNGEVVTNPYGIECDLTAETLSYWEETALRGGNLLNDLLV